MLTVIQAPVNWSFLAWIAYVPFLQACTPLLKAKWFTLVACAVGFLVGFLYWLGNVYWITPITLIGWRAMSFYLAWFWPLLALAVRFCRSKGIPLFIAFPVVLVGAERLQGFPMGGFFWRFLGHSQYEHLAVIQIADLVGAAGVSFVVAMVNGLLADLALFHLARRFRHAGYARRFAWIWETAGAHNWPYRLVPGVIVTTTVVVATTGYGQWRLGQTGQYLREGPTVAALQSNVPISVKRSFEASADIFDELMQKSRAAANAGAELIIWPETMVQGNLQPKLWQRIPDWDWTEDKEFHRALGEHAKGTAYVLVGAYGGEVLRDPFGEQYLGKYNSAYLYRPDGTIDPQRYDKIHLVLFGEYTPFRRSFPWLFRQLGRLLPEGYNLDYSLEHGKNYTIFEMNPLTASPNMDDGARAANPKSEIRNPKSEASPYHFGVIICYEDTIPYIGRNFALDEQGRKRVDWLVNISNDGWFVRFIKDRERVVPSTELPQHAAICVFRAVENRLPILRSVNTGISCLIESTGKIRDGYLAGSEGFPAKAMARTGLTGWFLDKMPIDTRVTFYSRHGEWFANCCATAFVASLAWPLGDRVVHRRKPRKAG
jgi:apolipoprotein N-acyltransferase